MRLKVLMIILMVAFAIGDISAFFWFYNMNVRNEARKICYDNGVELYEQSSSAYSLAGLGDAQECFQEAHGYKNAERYLSAISNEITMIQAYDLGVESYENDRYEDAYKVFETLQGYRDSDQYVAMMTSEIMQKANQYIDQEKYDEAKKLLICIPEYMGDDYWNAQQLYKSVEAISIEKEKSDNYAKAKECFQNEDYVTAQTIFMSLNGYKESYQYLEKIGESLYSKAEEQREQKEFISAMELLSNIDGDGTWSRYQDAADLKNIIYDECIVDALQRAENEYYATYEIAGAIDILESCEVGLGKDARLEAAIKDYRENTIVYLVNMDYFDETYSNSTYGGRNINETLIDNYEETFSNSMSCDCGHISYLVKDKGYSRFKGTVAFPKGYNSDGFRESANINIYADDKLIYTTQEFSATSKPEVIDLDITGAEVIEFEWNCEGWNIWHDWGYMATIYEGRFVK